MGVVYFPLACRWCGQDLQGQALDACCPKCTRAVGETLDGRLLDAEGRTVSTDLVCRHCGYNLRTLAADQVCPECGHLVADSLQPKGLRFADFGWLMKVHAGTTLLLIWLFGFFVMIFFGPIVLFLGWLHGLIWTAGMFRFTTPEPASAELPASIWPNQIARWAAIAYQIFLPVAFFVPLPIDIILVLGAYMVASIGLVLCMKQLAMRGNRPDIAWLATKQLVLSILTWPMAYWALLIVNSYFSIFPPGTPRPAYPITIVNPELTVLITAIMIGTSFVWAFVLLFKLEKMLNEAVDASSQMVGGHEK